VGTDAVALIPEDQVTAKFASTSNHPDGHRREKKKLATHNETIIETPRHHPNF
jgi:hypothetical protein